MTTSPANLTDSQLDALLDRAARNRLTGTDAQILDRHLQSVTPLPEGVAAPITTAVPANIAPVAYVLHKWSKHCLTCGSMHIEGSELGGSLAAQGMRAYVPGSWRKAW